MIVDRVREALVHRMFALADAGMGARGIANTFNKEGIKPWARFKGREPKIWEHTKITRILANRAVLGEFHPKVDGKPCPDGPWLDHYPVIVAADLFERVRQNANVREAVKGGAKSAEVPNLFSALARCECCGSNLAYQKGRKAGVFYTKGGKTYSYKRPVGSLVCRVAYNGGDCSNRAYVAYLTFEDAVLDMCLHLALDDGSFARKDEVARLNTLIAGRERAVNVATERAQALWRAFAQTASPMAMGVAQEAEAEAEELAKNVKALKRQREAARGRVSGAEHLARVAGIRANLYTKNLKERRQIRVKVAQSIRSVVTDITVNADKVATVVIANGLGIIRIDGKGRVLTPVLHGQPVLHQKEYQLAALDAADQMHATRTDILRRARRRTTENSGRKQLPDSETHESLGM
nr:recombinase family protein [Sphingomonas kaistensis]